MARRGDAARESVKNTIIAAFGDNFVAEQDKKIYVMAEDAGGEAIQFAITMTMPKVPIGRTSERSTIQSQDHDWTTSAVIEPNNGEISKEDADEVQRLMDALGIN